MGTRDPYQGGPDRTQSSDLGRGQTYPGEELEMRPASRRARGGLNRKAEDDRLNFQPTKCKLTPLLRNIAHTGHDACLRRTNPKRTVSRTCFNHVRSENDAKAVK